MAAWTGRAVDTSVMPSLVASVRTERVALSQLPGHLGCQLRREAARLADSGEFAQFELGLRREFPALTGEVCRLGVGLAAHGDIFAGGHGHRPSDQPRRSGEQDRLAALRRCSHAHDQARGQNDPVVGAKHGGAEPADPVHNQAPPSSNVIASGFSDQLLKLPVRKTASAFGAQMISDALQRALLAHGFVSAEQMRRHGPAIAEMIRIVLSHVARSREGAGLFDFADRVFVGALREVAAPVVADRTSWHVPPAKSPRRMSRAMTACAAGNRGCAMRHDPASAAIVIMMRSLKVYGMAQAVEDLVEQGSSAFEAAVPILSQLLKAEVAEREVRSIAYHLKAARFPAYKDLAGFDFAASEINEALVRQLHRGEFIDGAHNVVLIGGPGTARPTSRRRLASRPSSITGRRSGSSPPSNSSTCSSKRRQRA